MHDVNDDQIGSIVAGLPYLLIPGDYTGIMSAATPISTTTVNIGTWDAYRATGGPPTASNTDDAMVIVNAPAPLVCGGNPVAFDAGIPPDWTVVDNLAGVWTGTGAVNYPADCGQETTRTAAASLHAFRATRPWILRTTANSSRRPSTSPASRWSPCSSRPTIKTPQRAGADLFESTSASTAARPGSTP